VSLDVDQVLDARPAWVERAWQRQRRLVAGDPRRRRRWLAVAVAVWVLGETIAPRRQVAPVRRLLITMIVFDSAATYVWVSTGIAVEGNPIVATLMDLYGDALGLLLRTLWSIALVAALAWLAERRAAVRPALVLPLLALGAVTLLHVTRAGPGLAGAAAGLSPDPAPGYAAASHRWPAEGRRGVPDGPFHGARIVVTGAAGCPDTSLARRTLDRQATTSLADGLARTVAWFRRAQ
jgi:hypothetical protein